jgi:hypothetical protein
LHPLRKTYQPGIGGLGEPQYQPESLRIKGFCEIIESVDHYRHYLETVVFLPQKTGVTELSISITKAGFLPSEA